MTGHAGTTHPLVRMAALPFPPGIAWCELCRKQVWLARREPSPPPQPYKARPRKPRPAAPPPLKAKVAARSKVERKSFAEFHDVKGCA